MQIKVRSDLLQTDRPKWFSSQKPEIDPVLFAVCNPECFVVVLCLYLLLEWRIYCQQEKSEQEKNKEKEDSWAFSFGFHNVPHGSHSLLLPSIVMKSFGQTDLQ